ncbi:hypothetical protein Droror1_Dr00001807 [Drosera rotundifolia]
MAATATRSDMVRRIFLQFDANNDCQRLGRDRGRRQKIEGCGGGMRPVGVGLSPNGIGFSRVGIVCSGLIERRRRGGGDRGDEGTAEGGDGVGTRWVIAVTLVAGIGIDGI